MNFEIERTIRSVLDFYQSSGLLASNLPTIQCNDCFCADGKSEALEQMLYFIFGHLFPESVPTKIECSSELGTSGTNLRLNLVFSGFSLTAIKEVYTLLQEDQRLKKMLDLSKSNLQLVIHPESDYKEFSLSYPVEKTYEQAQDQIINFADLEKRYDDLELGKTLLEGYVMNASRHISLMKSSMEKEDWKEVHRHAHALKGGALNVCAEALARKAKNIETKVKENNYIDIQAYVDQLESACIDLEKAWAKYQEEANG